MASRLYYLCQLFLVLLVTAFNFQKLEPQYFQTSWNVTSFSPWTPCLLNLYPLPRYYFPPLFIWHMYADTFQIYISCTLPILQSICFLNISGIPSFSCHFSWIYNRHHKWSISTSKLTPVLFHSQYFTCKKVTMLSKLFSQLYEDIVLFMLFLLQLYGGVFQRLVEYITVLLLHLMEYVLDYYYILKISQFWMISGKSQTFLQRLKIEL